MKLLSSLRSMTSAIIHRAQTEDELDEELRARVRSRAQDPERSGLTPVDAERPHGARRPKTKCSVDGHAAGFAAGCLRAFPLPSLSPGWAATGFRACPMAFPQVIP